MIRRGRVSAPLTRGLEILLMVLFLASPLIISTRLKQVFNTPKYALVGFVAVFIFSMLAVDWLFERRVRMPAHRGAWYLFGFTAWAGVSLLWSSDMAVALRDFGYQAAMAAIFLGAFVYGREEERVDNLLHFPIAAGVLAAAFGLLQFYEFDEKILPRIDVGPWLVFFGVVLVGAGASAGGAADAIGSALDPRRRSLRAALLSDGLVALLDPRRPTLPLALLAGMGAGFDEAGVQVTGLLVTAAWFYYRWLDDRQSALNLGMRLVLGVLALILSRLVNGQCLLLLSAAILFDEEAESEGRTSGATLLGAGLIAVGITAWMQAWNLAFLVLPIKPDEAVKVYSFMGHRNYLGGFLIAVLPLAVVRLLAVWCVVPVGESDRWRRTWRLLVYLATITLLTVVLMLTHTRGAWIGAIVSLSFLSVWVLVKYMPFRPQGLLVPVFGAMALVVVLFGWKRMEIPYYGLVTNPFNRHVQSAGSRMAETLNIQAGSAFQRALIYRTTWAIIFDHPVNCLFGTGIGTFGLHYMPAQREVVKQPANRKYLPMLNKSIYAHNEYWHYWSEVGLVGLLLLWACFYQIGKSAHTRLRQEPPGVPNLMFLGMASSLIATGTHNFFTFDFHLPYSGGIFFALLGIVLAQSDGEFRIWSWAEHSASATESQGVRVDLELERLDGQVVARAFVEPPGRGSPVLVLIGPEGAKTDVTESQPGYLEATLPEIPGSYRAELEHLGIPVPPLQLAVGRTGNPWLVPGLLVVGMVQISLVSSLANQILADMYWRDGFLKFRARRFEESFLDYEKAISADPTKGEVLFDFGRALMDSNRNRPAIKVFEQAKHTFVDPANDHNMALCHYKEGDVAASERHYQKAIFLNEIYEQSLANLAYLYLSTGRDDEALPLLELGYSLYRRTNISFATSLAVLHAKLGDFARSETYFDEVTAKNPDKASVWINAGTVKYNLKKLDEAEAAFQKALAFKGEEALVKQKLGLVYLARWGERAMTEPNNLEVRRNYAASLLAAGHVGPAAQEAKNILNSVPTDWPTRFTYARALELGGHIQDARREYARVVAEAPPGETLVVEARNKLAALPATAPIPGAPGANPGTPAPNPGGAFGPVETPGPAVVPGAPVREAGPDR